MTTPWRKAFRDFQEESTRTTLVVLAIAVGIAAFTAVLASYAILTRELNHGYLATNPASATLRTDAVDDELVDSVRAVPGVRDVEPRRTISGRIKGNAPGWRNLVLFVVKDFANNRVSKINRESGAWPPAAGEILIERDAFQVAQIAIGDRVVVRTLNGPERSLHVTGSVHDVGQAQARMENIVYGYITPATLQQLGEEPVLNQLKLVIDGDESHIRSVVADVKKLAASRGHEVTRIDIPAPGKHPHADIMGLTMLVLASFGFIVLMLSGVIVVNLLTALMAAQVRQIGVMKAIGGRRSQIARIYFLQSLLLGVAAIVIAVPVGVWGSRVLCRAMAVFLNFDITSFAIPPWVFVLVAIAGLAVPLAAAAIPVAWGSRVSVRRALTETGVGTNSFGVSRFERMIAGIGGVTRPLLLSMRNGLRRRGRLLLTMSTLAAGGLFFMTALNVRTSMINTLDRLFDTKKYDMSLSIAGMAQSSDVIPIVRRTPGVRDAEAWIASEGGMGNAIPSRLHAGGGGGSAHGGGGGMTGDRFLVIALPPGTRFFAPTIDRGRWLRDGESDTIVVNTALAAKNRAMQMGKTATFPMGPGTVTFRVVGIAREPFSPPTAYIPRAFFDERMGHTGITNNVRLSLDKTDSTSIDRVKGLLESNLGREGIKVASMSSKRETRFGFDQHMVMIYVVLVIVSALIAGVGGLGLMTTMSINVLERRREIGVLRAVGATPRTIALMLIVEGAAIAIASWAVAGLAAWPLSKALGNVLVTTMFKSALDFAFEVRGLVVWLVVSLLLGAIASVIPALHATRLSIREALGYE